MIIDGSVHDRQICALLFVSMYILTVDDCKGHMSHFLDWLIQKIISRIIHNESNCGLQP